MYSETFEPRFYETDALGHINNTVFPAWFESTRTPIFRFFTPDLDAKKWKLIIASLTCEFKREVLYNESVTIKTAVKRIGNSSFTTTQACYQYGKLATVGETVIVQFDHHAKQSLPMNDVIRAQLSEHLLEGDWPLELDE